jgi:hypothetical protein
VTVAGICLIVIIGFISLILLMLTKAFNSIMALRTRIALHDQNLAALNVKVRAISKNDDLNAFVYGSSSFV